MKTKIFQAKWTVISPSHTKTTQEFIILVRHHLMTKCGYSVDTLKKDRSALNYLVMRSKMYFRWARFKIADWQVLGHCLLIFVMVDVILFSLALCFVSPTRLHKNVIRKFEYKVEWPHQNYFSSFDGETFKSEASSKFPHAYAMALGSYRKSPFVTGASSGFKTEILNLESGEWEQAGDYPFSNGNRYVSKDFIESHSAH